MIKAKNRFIRNLRYLYLIPIIVFGFMTILGSGDYFDKPEGACVYGPSDLKYCINGTFEDECKDDFKGVWWKDKTCDQINY
jgi:hypothetical protein